MVAGDKEVHNFPEVITPKVNAIARLKFELAYFKAIVHCVNITPHRLSLPPTPIITKLNSVFTEYIRFVTF